MASLKDIAASFPEDALYHTLTLPHVDYSGSIDPRVNTKKTYLTLNLRGDIGVPAGEAKILSDIAALKGTFGEQDLLFGLSGILNLDLIFAAGLGGGVIGDKNATQPVMLSDFLGLIYETPSRKNILGAFSDRMNGAPRPGKDYYFPQASYYQSEPGYSDLEQQALYRLIHGNDAGARASFLNSDAGYDYIRTLVREGKIVPLTIDLTDTDRMQSLKDALGEKRIGLVYTSNVFFYLKLEKDFFLNPNDPAVVVPKALDNLDLLLEGCTVNIIDAGLKKPHGAQLQIYTPEDLRKVHLADISKSPPPLPPGSGGHVL